MQLMKKTIRVLSILLIIFMIIPSNITYADQGNGTGTSDSGSIGKGSNEAGRVSTFLRALAL